MPDAKSRSISRRIIFFRVGEQPYGAWRWWRRGKAGVVLRVGPLGHVQFAAYRMRFFGSGEKDGRRGRHGVDVHVWGVSGRRRKRGFGIYVHL